MAGTSDQIRASRRSASDRGQSLTVSNAGPGHESNQLGSTTNKDTNTLNLDPDPEFWPNLTRIQGYVNNFEKKIKIILEGKKYFYKSLRK